MRKNWEQKNAKKKEEKEKSDEICACAISHSSRVLTHSYSIQAVTSSAPPFSSDTWSPLFPFMSVPLGSAPPVSLSRPPGIVKLWKYPTKEESTSCDQVTCPRHSEMALYGMKSSSSPTLLCWTLVFHWIRLITCPHVKPKPPQSSVVRENP